MDGYCNAETKKGGKCKKKAGYGTPHIGVGYCYVHEKIVKSEIVKPTKGMFTTNKKVDRYDKKPIWLRYMDDEIQCNWDTINVSIRAQLDNELKLCDARIAYIMHKIKDLDDGDNMIKVSENSQTVQGETSIKGEITPINTITTSEKFENYGDSLGKWNEALTRVQAVKSKALDLKVRLEMSEKEAKNDSNNMLALSQAITQSATFLNKRMNHQPTSSLSLGKED
jgi:hypothetical protein